MGKSGKLFVMPSPKAPPPICQLRITLTGIKPPIWRIAGHSGPPAGSFQRSLSSLATSITIATCIRWYAFPKAV
jgi:hypothetical protein